MPGVLHVFKIIMDYIWNVMKYQIPLGNGFSVSIWNVNVFVTLLVVFMKFIVMDNNFKPDRTQSFSKPRQRREKNVRPY